VTCDNVTTPHQTDVCRATTDKKVDRAVAGGLVERVGDSEDQRVVRIRLSDAGARRAEALASAHIEELSRLRTQFASLWDDLPEPAL
jgi:DNA-binding MarR family transcriptional regulator